MISIYYYLVGMFKLFRITVNGSSCVLKAKVRASQRMMVLHLAWVAVKRKDRSVITGHCKCMAGYVVCFFE